MGAFLEFQAWKAGRAPMEKATPRYRREPPPEEMPVNPERPTLKLRQISEGRLIVPRDIRQTFLSCSVFGPEWRSILKEFDSQRGQAVAGSDGGGNQGDAAAGKALTKNEEAKTEVAKKEEENPMFLEGQHWIKIPTQKYFPVWAHPLQSTRG